MENNPSGVTPWKPSNPHGWFQINPWSLPSPRDWCHEVLESQSLPEEEALEKLRAVVNAIADRPTLQDWLDEMLDWSFTSRRALEVLLDLGAQAKSYHLGQLFNASWRQQCSAAEMVLLTRRMVEAGADPSRCAHMGAEFPMEPALALAFRNFHSETAIAVGEVLLAEGAPIDGPGPEWSHPSGLKRPLEVAAASGKAEVFRWCLEKGARLDLVPDPTFPGCDPSVMHVLQEVEATRKQSLLESAFPEGKLSSRGPRL